MLERVLRKAALEVTMDERKVWARSIEGAIKDATRSYVPLRNRVARPVVVIAAAPSLSAVAAVLRDETAASGASSFDRPSTAVQVRSSPSLASIPMASPLVARRASRLGLDPDTLLILAASSTWRRGRVDAVPGGGRSPRLRSGPF